VITLKKVKNTHTSTTEYTSILLPVYLENASILWNYRRLNAFSHYLCNISGNAFWWKVFSVRTLFYTFCIILGLIQTILVDSPNKMGTATTLVATPLHHWYISIHNLLFLTIIHAFKIVSFGWICCCCCCCCSCARCTYKSYYIKFLQGPIYWLHSEFYC
jgi:hypothetical protein